MVIGTDNISRARKNISTDDKKKALLLITELKARGLPIPEGLEVDMFSNNTSWNVDPNGYFVRNDGTIFRPRPVLVDFINCTSRFILLKSGRGGGKALWVETPILTENRGWSTMGELKVGDYVFDNLGIRTRVNFTSDIMYNHNCFEVKFIDGTSVIADEEHLWTVLPENGRIQKNRGGKSDYYKTLTTKDMLADHVREYRTKIYNYSVDVCDPVNHKTKELLMHPYVFGAWLGDGSSRDSTITISPDDREMVEIIQSFGYSLHNVTDEFTWSFGIRGDGSGFRYALQDLGVWKNKHIPEIYLQSSVKQRQLLLMGLMDTDGTISKRGHCSFDNKNKDLAYSVFELVSSLGMKASIHRYEVLEFKTPTWYYKVTFTPNMLVFMLYRKMVRQEFTYYNYKRNSRRAIVSITPVDSVPVRCIEVDSPSHLFLVTKSFIATHNTTASAQKALLRIKSGESGAVMSPDFENFRTSTWPELQKWIPWSMVVPKHRYRASPSWEAIRPFTIVFLNGAKMYCKGLKDPESARGANLNWFWYDEGRRDPTGLGWKNAVAFLRIGNLPQAWCSTTMAGMEHWTNTFFQGESTDELKGLIEEMKAKGIEQEMFSIFKTSPKENEENLAPGYLASLVSTYPAGFLRTREIDGEASDEGGSLGDRRWFDGKGLDAYPDWAVKNVRFWDLAATEQKILRGKKLNDPDETVGTLVGCDMNKDIAKTRYVIQDSFGGYWEWSHIKKMILETAVQDGSHVEICFEQEPASGGKNQVAELMDMLKKELPGWKSSALEAKKLGDRVLAANTWFAEAANGQWYYVKNLWNEKVFQQLDRFDGIQHDDRITSITGARHWIAPVRKKWSSVKFLSLGSKK